MTAIEIASEPLFHAGQQSTPPRHRCSSTPPAPPRTPAPCAPRRWQARSPPPSARRSRRTAARQPDGPVASPATDGPPSLGRARTNGCTGSHPGCWPGTRPTTASASRRAGVVPGAPRPSRARPCAVARQPPRRPRTAVPPAHRPSASPAAARPGRPPLPGPGTAAPYCAPRPPQGRSPGRRRTPRTSAAGSLARVASTISRPASRPPRILSEGGPGPAQRSSNHPPHREWPTSDRNGRLQIGITGRHQIGTGGRLAPESAW